MSIQTSFSLGDLGQCPIPSRFQFRCNQSVARVYRFVLALSVLGLVADPLQGQFQPPFFLIMFNALRKALPFLAAPELTSWDLVRFDFRMRWFSKYCSQEIYPGW